MYHLATVTIRAAGMLAAAALGGGWLLAGTPAAVAATSATMSAPVSYSCDFDSYGQGLAPLTVDAAVSAQSGVTAGTSLTVTLVTSPAGIPSATAFALPALNYLSLAGTSTLSPSSAAGTSGSTSLTGRSGYLGAAAGAMNEIPSLTATGTLTPRTAGTGYITAPSTITIVPSGTSGSMAPVVCTRAAVVSVKVTVLTGSAGTGMGAPSTGGTTAGSGTQPYSCAVTASATTGTPSASMVPMRLSYSGPNAVAAADQVSLTSTAQPASGALGMPMPGATPMAASASLGLEGASGGGIPLGAVMSGGRLALTGQWQPSRAGVFRLVAPHLFRVRLRTTSRFVVVVCTATTAATVTTTVHVAVSAMSSEAAQGIAASETNSSPAASAPDTGAGGSLHSPVNMAMLAGGIAAAAAGIVIMFLTIRRRGRAMTS